MSDEASSSGTPKSRQERIRDNQRRSRARRQEYLSDLERRLADCQATCREADLQRAAFIELQIENTRLRELLSLTGMNDDVVEEYVSKATLRAGQSEQNVAPGLRPLKPNLRAPTTSSEIQAISPDLRPSRTPTASSFLPTSNNMFDERRLTPSFTTYTPAPAALLTASQTASESPNLAWLFQELPRPVDSSAQAFRCDAFHVVTQQQPPPSNENTILCSIAKDMINQYQIPAQEMEQIKARLAAGFRRPAHPEAGCGVDNQVLLMVLNDLSTRYG